VVKKRYIIKIYSVLDFSFKIFNEMLIKKMSETLTHNGYVYGTLLTLNLI
jgi:hypothetical protein